MKKQFDVNDDAQMDRFNEAIVHLKAWQNHA